ncbi:MAG: hypothetical protein HFG16_00010 [Erysipelotrichaceae bacterium]|jgi:hypothetical protein|nr:hypothetical protein [Erysipelotrichaceae bacterium]
MEVKLLQQYLQMAHKENGIQQGKWHMLCENYLKEHEEEYLHMPAEAAIPRLISAQNLKDRRNLLSCESLGVHISIGDICFIDFGDAYLQEIGYQHFGLIAAMYHGKAFVIPMSGNYNAYLQAYSRQNPNGKQHLMQLGKIAGMRKPSVLFINDAKWINTARIIDVKAHLDKDSELFKDIKERVKRCLD